MVDQCETAIANCLKIVSDVAPKRFTLEDNAPAIDKEYQKSLPSEADRGIQSSQPPRIPNWQIYSALALATAFIIWLIQS